MTYLPSFLLVFLLTSCAGYSLKKNNNPFAQYDINEITIPQFFNQSSIAGCAPRFTQEIVQTLLQFGDLKVKVGAGKKSPAVLLGIITSPDTMAGKKGTIQTDSRRLAKNVAPVATTGRQDFFIPLTNRINLTLNLILIRQPSKEEVDLLISSLGKDMRGGKIVFNESIPVSYSFVRETADSTSSSDAGTVNFTQNKGNLEKAVNEMAKSAAENFKQMVLYAF